MYPSLHMDLHLEFYPNKTSPPPYTACNSITTGRMIPSAGQLISLNVILKWTEEKNRIFIRIRYSA